jgi:cytochrome c oxidase cbb3-type subunit I
MQYPPDAQSSTQTLSPCIASAVWHGLFWLVLANAIGAMIAILLLFPDLNQMLGEWSYGRWIMVHMNLELYGWVSLPLAGFLFKVYGADRGPFAPWCQPVLWVWSAALAVGTYSWLTGHSSGKLFLDWSGYARIFFPLAMIALWLLLAISFIRRRKSSLNAHRSATGVQVLGLVLLLLVPVALYIASSPSLYPAINPDTGGPTGASQLESSLVIVAILLLLPFGLTQRKTGPTRLLTMTWIILVAEFMFCLSVGRSDISHHRLAQFISLGSLLVWIPLTPVYYAAFEWAKETLRWQRAMLHWWSALLLTGWVLFLPRVLDHFKFTDGLVGHSFLAMAGFVSSLLIFIVIQMLGKDGWIFNRARSFYGWNYAVLGYVAVMTVAGWREGFDPSFTIVPGVARNTLYALRLLTGVVMLAASLDWLVYATKLLRQSAPLPAIALLEQEAIR